MKPCTTEGNAAVQPSVRPCTTDSSVAVQPSVFLTVRQAAAVLSMSEAALRAFIKRGGLPGGVLLRLGKRALRVSLPALVLWLTARPARDADGRATMGNTAPDPFTPVPATDVKRALGQSQEGDRRPEKPSRRHLMHGGRGA